MPLVLSLPGLLARDAYPAAPSLARLIASAGAPAREPEGIAAVLAPLYGVQRQDDWPLAPIRLAALGIDPGSAYWLAADPVTLVVGRDDVRLEDAVRDLSDADAQALVAMLNSHFASDGLSFVAPCPHAWFVHAPSPPALRTHSLESARGRSLRELLPEGADARTWRRWQNEAQMLLFEHPVNIARERSGKPCANSVWFADGGTMPARGERAATTIRTWSDDPTVVALAAFAGGRAQPADDARRCIDDTVRESTRVVALEAPIDIAHVERTLAVPAWKALAAGALDAVTIAADGCGEALVFRAQRPSLWARMTSGVAKPDLAALIAQGEKV